MTNASQYSDSSNYGYTPSGAWAIVFIVLFSVSALVHCFQAYRSKYWIVYPTLVLGALTEILGWSARYWSSRNVLLITPFIMQISTLIIAPVFFSAFDYTMLGMAISRLGQQYSLLRPMYFFIIFISADVLSLVLQAVGGGQASSQAADGSPTASATHIMVAGIIFQLISMGIFIFLLFDFMLRLRADRPYAFQLRRLERIRGANGGAVEKNAGSDDALPRRENMRNWWIFMMAVTVSSLMIIIRGVYRSDELWQGWTGFLITHQNYQNALDGVPMVLAVGLYNFVHPAYLLPAKDSWKGYH